MGSLIEMVFVLGAAAVLTVIGIQQDVAKRRSQVLAIEGQNEAVIVKALGRWINDHYQALLEQYQQSGPVLPAPSLDQLHADGSLKQTYAKGPFWGGDYVIALTMVPASCSVDEGNCHVSYRFYPSLPYSRNGVTDVAGAAQIALAGSASGAQFGYSSTRNAATVYGINGAWNAPNPLPGSPAAALLATNGPDGMDGNSLYIRRDGSLTWTGPQNVNGVDLHNVGNIDAQGTVAAPALSASNVAVSNAVRSPGTLYVQNAAGDAPAPVDAGAAAFHGNAVVRGTLAVANTAVPRSACTSPAGTTTMAANADGSGQILSCLYNQWVPVSGPAPRYQYYNVAYGSYVPAPPCSAGGSPQILLVPQSFYINETAQFNAYVQGTGPWTVYLTDGNNANNGAQGVVETYCAY